MQSLQANPRKINYVSGRRKMYNCYNYGCNVECLMNFFYNYPPHKMDSVAASRKR